MASNTLIRAKKKDLPENKEKLYMYFICVSFLKMATHTNISIINGRIGLLAPILVVPHMFMIFYSHL